MPGGHFQLDLDLERLPDQLRSGDLTAESPGAQACPCQIHTFYCDNEYLRGFNHARVHGKTF